MLRKLWLALAVLILLIQSNAVTANNRCFMPQSVSEEFKVATAVFIGKVVAQQYRPVEIVDRDHPQGSEILVVKVMVEKYWKGDVTKEAEMYTTVTKLSDGLIQSYSEDFNFEVGKEYLIYAFGPQNQLHTNACTRTVTIEKAQDDIKELGQGKVPILKQ